MKLLVTRLFIRLQHLPMAGKIFLVIGMATLVVGLGMWIEEVKG